MNISKAWYRVIQQVSDLGWVDFDLDAPLIFPSPLYLALISLSRIWQTQELLKYHSTKPRSVT